MSSTLVLVVLNGPQAGMTAPLQPGRTVVIGRGGEGLQLTDPLVSIHHAEVSRVGDKVWLEDRGSAGGTLLHGARVATPVALRPGSTFTVGGTRVMLRQKDAVRWFAMGSIAVSGLALAATLILWHELGSLEEPQKVVGTTAHGQDFAFEVPASFAWRTEVRKVPLEVLEGRQGPGGWQLWLTSRRGTWRVQVAADDTWTVLDVLPPNCRLDEAPGADPAVLRCGGVRWTEGPEDTWLPAPALSTYVWPRQGADAPLGAPPVKATPADAGRVETFLARQGIIEPAHYILCETAVPGVPAQVLLQGGERRLLEDGCTTSLSLKDASGPGGRPVDAVALSETGRYALVEDISMFDGGRWGTPQAQWGQTKNLARLAPPKRGGALRVVDDPWRDADTPREEWPVPREPWLMHGEAETAGAWVTAGPLSTHADWPACLQAEVEQASLACLHWTGCTPSSVFAEVTLSGCDAPEQVLELAYGQSSLPFEHGPHEGRLKMKVHRRLASLQVDRAWWEIWPRP